jgi:hypothetical protein
MQRPPTLRRMTTCEASSSGPLQFYSALRALRAREGKSGIAFVLEDATVPGPGGGRPVIHPYSSMTLSVSAGGAILHVPRVAVSIADRALSNDACGPRATAAISAVARADGMIRNPPASANSICPADRPKRSTISHLTALAGVIVKSMSHSSILALTHGLEVCCSTAMLALAAWLGSNRAGRFQPAVGYKGYIHTQPLEALEADWKVSWKGWQ